MEHPILSGTDAGSFIYGITKQIENFRIGKLADVMGIAESAAWEAMRFFQDLRRERERMVALAALIATGKDPLEAQELIYKMHDSFVSK